MVRDSSFRLTKEVYALFLSIVKRKWLARRTGDAACENGGMRGANLRRLLYLLPCVLLVTQCATRAPTLTSAQLADVGRAEALMRDGCYACLRETAGIYARLLEPAARKPPERVLRGAFDTAILLAVREKELGMPADASLARARELGSRVSPAAPAVLLEAADAVSGDVTMLDAEERLQKEQRKPAPAPQLTSTPSLTSASSPTSAPSPTTTSDLTSAYLAIALRCEQPSGSRAALAQNDSTSPPLLKYRAAICSSGERTAALALTKMREADPRWAEIYFFEGKYEMGSPARSADPERAAALLTQASAAFPDSIAIRLMLANAHDMAGNAAAALDAFDRVLAVKPAHVDARLGRVQNLSYLSRADEAIAAATAMIDTGTWHVGDAYYWRAWNRYQSRQLDEAWADVRQAMSLLSNTSVYALAGSIAYARRELDTAIAHFTRAFEIDPSNCMAVWSAGLVHGDRAAWPDAAGTFAKAATCFATAADRSRKELASLESAALAPAVKERRLASTRKRLESSEDLRGQATLNVARSAMRAWMPTFQWLSGVSPWGPDIMRRD
jgi:tetratricopeptide (TPR) repeat protein